MLKDHPFAVEAHFKRSIVLTFAVPKADLQDLVPECLALDTYDDKWGFLAIALVQTKDLRPKGFPAFLGNDFFLIGYRIFTRYINRAGKRLRGLYILKSETDKRKMEFLGNVFTHYHYTTTDITQTHSGREIETSSERSDFRFTVDLDDDNVSLPPESPFPDWKTARRYAGPLPFTFTFNSATQEVLIIEGVRQDWKPEPVHVSEYRFAFLDNLNLKNAVLANAFAITDIPYYWKKGKKELWGGNLNTRPDTQTITM